MAPFDSTVLSPKRPTYPLDKYGHPSPTLHLKSPRMIRSKYVNEEHAARVPFRANFSNATERHREEVEDKKVFVYDPPMVHDVYRQNTPPPRGEPNDYEVVIEPRKKDIGDKAGEGKKNRGNRLLRKKYNYLFKSLASNQPKKVTWKTMEKEKRKIETKKRSAPKIQLLSNKAERWKHPAVNTAFKREVDRQRKEREAYQDIDTIENEVGTPKTKKEGILRSPSRLDEEKRKEVLSSIRTRLLYNRFDWNSHGRFVPAHRPFNPRMYGNGK